VSQVDDVIDSVSAIVEPVYLVGGSVRDALMGRACTDFDFSTPLGPDEVEQAIRDAGRRPYLMGKRFGTVAFRLDGLTIELTTFRSECYTPGSRRPSVEFLPDLRDDLGRRDFTINAMARHGDRLIDLFGGQDDLAAGIVRAVGEPAERFAEDPLRMLRAARFASQLDFAVDPHTALAARELAPQILEVARERWMTELDRMLVGPGVQAGLRLLAETGLLGFMLPELGLQTGITAPGGRTLFDVTVEAVSSAGTDVAERWGVLMRDVGVPYLPAAGLGEGTLRADPSEARAALGAQIVDRTALYLKWSTRRREDVRRMVSGTASEGR
jgi:poly(A) polymerase